MIIHFRSEFSRIIDDNQINIKIILNPDACTIYWISTGLNWGWVDPIQYLVLGKGSSAAGKEVFKRSLHHQAANKTIKRRSL